DLNGNLITKTDARGIQTTMKYDVLNRLTSKSYSDGTPTATFYYDTAPMPWGTGIQNTNGRLVEATTGITPEP
ncbi:MAG TPA: RHS repeat domain-containing protein, partial [Candidatus Sulfotelmatobacter sp.]|nr:RHS repeat domain-containing protein [Candidatus Sulfotelmatobacter sp.]